MNRTIKFRAWDEGKKAWVYFGLPWEQPDLGNQIAPFTVGQFTGLNDKNGKEIYEGDVVELSAGIRKEVIFHKGTFCYRRGEHEYHIFDERKVEVIGNIYENPELV